MDIASFLTKEDPIAGLEISDSHIRLCFFTQDKDKKKGELKLSLQKERELPADAIKNGVIIDRQAVIKTLTSLLTSLPKKIRYVIVAIPAHATYIKLFDFPKAIYGKKLEETMGLTIGFQIPFRAEDIYLDWETTADTATNEVVLTAAKKPLIDEYIAVLTAAKLNPVAIEPHVFAVLRAANIPDEDHILIVDETSATDTLFWIANKGTVQFMRSFPKRLVAQKDDELRKISAWYEAEHHATPKVLQGKRDVWLAASGAARRGAIPRAQDSLISLMPMGTVEAYRRQRAIAFVEFIANAIVGISIFFSVAYMGTWVLMSSLQQRTLIQIENLNALPIAPDTGELETRARLLNELTGAAHQALQKLPHWSTVIEEVRKRSAQGITVTNAGFPSPEDALTITGTAADRESLSAFKRSMEESALFTDISLPPTNLEVREAIPFSLSFKLKDPTAIYAK